MAKSRSRRSGRAKRRPADWVYRGFENDNEGSNFYDHISYGAPDFTTASNGTSGFILYDSKNYLELGSGAGGVGNPGWLNQSARASGRRAQTWRVQGAIEIVASTWALGNVMRFGIRIGVFPQDPDTGDALVPTTNNLMYDVFSLTYQAAVWANATRQNLWEKRFYKTYAAGNESSSMMIYVNAPARARLGDDEALVMLLCNGAGVALRGKTWLRTYVSDEG